MSAKLVPTLRIEGVAWSAQRIPTVANLEFLYPEPLFLHSSSSSFIFTRLNGPCSRPRTSQKIWWRRESNLGSMDFYPGTQNTTPQMRSFVIINWDNLVKFRKSVRLDIVPSRIRISHSRNANQASCHLHIVLGCCEYKCVIIVSCNTIRAFFHRSFPCFQSIVL
jgi:hypothetical protein